MTGGIDLRPSFAAPSPFPAGVNRPALLSRRSAGSLLIGAMLSPAAACGQASAPGAAAAARKPLDAAALSSAVNQAQALPQLRAMIVAQNGAILVERVFRGPSLTTPVNIKSAAKTVVATLAGVALDRGVLTGLDQKIAPVLKGRVPAAADPRVRDITVEHLLSMAAGLESTSGRNYGTWVSSRDWLGYALSRPFVAQPGTRMVYSTGTSHILSAVLTAASGKSTLQLARDWLGVPLGFEVPPWTRDPQGIYFGGNEMALSPRALFTLGEMYRNQGLHDGKPVLSRAFAQDAWRSRGGRSPYNGYTYGLGWWLRDAGEHAVNFAWGYGGQMLYVVPSLGITAVFTSDPNVRGVDGHVQALHALFDTAVVGVAT